MTHKRRAAREVDLSLVAGGAGAARTTRRLA